MKEIVPAVLSLRVRRKRGQGLAEYALLIAAVAAVVFAALTPLSTIIVNLVTSITSGF